MTPLPGPLDLRVTDALAASPSPIPLIVGDCGSGRTSLLLRQSDRLGAARCQYIDLERVATTPERFLRAVTARSPFAVGGAAAPRPPGTPRAAFDATVQFLQAAHTPDGRPATFLLDEVLEVRTFEHFPGLRTVLPELLAALSDSPNRFVLTSRFAARTARLLSGAPARIELLRMPALSPADIARVLGGASDAPGADAETARTIHALSAGHPGHAVALASEVAALAGTGPADPVAALAALLAPGGRIDASCRYSYELRLHRARGYGALKAILDVLAEEEPLTLTKVSQRLQRTPGSTKDYLSWLVDVDLIDVSRKKYRFTDPIMRLWVRLHGRPTPPADEDVAREVQRYASERIANAAPGLVVSPAESAAPEPPAAPIAPGPARESTVLAPAAPRPANRSDIIEFD
jgi:hypothetical protein